MFTIEVVRRSRVGTLYYRSLGIETNCWWDYHKKIPAGTYRGCSATTMSSKLNSKGGPREGIFIPNIRGHHGIFIHMGSDPSWSDGCVVIEEDKLLRIWNDIPRDSHNTTVTIRDL